MKLTIDRIRWLVGERPGHSKLFRSNDGKMCCLGFYCIAKGATLDEITDKSTPCKLADAPTRFPEAVTGKRCNDTIGAIMHVNDACSGSLGSATTLNWTLAQREARLTELFKQIGIEVEFIN